MTTKIIGTGSYLPEHVVSNDDLAKLVDTSDEWIQTRTGIASRYPDRDSKPTNCNEGKWSRYGSSCGRGSIKRCRDGRIGD